MGTPKPPKQTEASSLLAPSAAQTRSFQAPGGRNKTGSWASHRSPARAANLPAESFPAPGHHPQAQAHAPSWHSYTLFAWKPVTGWVNGGSRTLSLAYVHTKISALGLGGQSDSHTEADLIRALPARGGQLGSHPPSCGHTDICHGPVGKKDPVSTRRGWLQGVGGEQSLAGTSASLTVPITVPIPLLGRAAGMNTHGSHQLPYVMLSRPHPQRSVGSLCAASVPWAARTGHRGRRGDSPRARPCVSTRHHGASPRCWCRAGGHHQSLALMSWHTGRRRGAPPPPRTLYSCAPPSYLSNIDAQVLLIVRAVANHQA